MRARSNVGRLSSMLVIRTPLKRGEHIALLVMIVWGIRCVGESEPAGYACFVVGCSANSSEKRATTIKMMGGDAH